MDSGAWRWALGSGAIPAVILRRADEAERLAHEHVTGFESAMCAVIRATGTGLPAAPDVQHTWGGTADTQGRPVGSGPRAVP